MRALLLIIIFSCFAILSGGEYQVKKSGQNHIRFSSLAPFDTVIGISSAIDGYIYWAGDDPADSSQIYFEVPLNTLDTGIGLRNRHMYENYLETDLFPLATFSGKVIKSNKKEKGDFNVTLHGEMSIHGQTRVIDISGRMYPNSDSEYQISTEYSIRLTDYHIQIPKLMFLKLDNNIHLQINFTVVKYAEEAK